MLKAHEAAIALSSCLAATTTQTAMFEALFNYATRVVFTGAQALEIANATYKVGGPYSAPTGTGSITVRPAQVIAAMASDMADAGPQSAAHVTLVIDNIRADYRSRLGAMAQKRRLQCIREMAQHATWPSTWSGLRRRV